MVSLTALAVSCGPVDPPAPTSLVPLGYTATFTEVRNCRRTIEHMSPSPGGPTINFIRVLTNPEAASAYRMNAPRLAVGSLVIKEEYGDDPACERRNLRSWTLMRKEAVGYDREHNDWHWQRVRSADSVVISDGIATVCISCHNRPSCTARDWQCTEP
jgi:hypothetical protein